MYSYSNLKEAAHGRKESGSILSSYSREKMLTLNKSPICLLRPALFHTVVRDLPELVRLAPSSDEIVLLTTTTSVKSISHT